MRHHDVLDTAASFLILVVILAALTIALMLGTEAGLEVGR